MAYEIQNQLTPRIIQKQLLDSSGVVFNLFLVSVLYVSFISPDVGGELHESKREFQFQHPECSRILFFCKETIRKLDEIGCSITNATLNTNSSSNDNSSKSSVSCDFSDVTNILQANSAIQLLTEKVTNLELEIQKLKKGGQRRKQHRPGSGPTSSNHPDVDTIPSFNTTLTVLTCTKFILLNKFPAALRQWKLIEDHFITQNNFQVSFIHLKQVILRSYNHQRSHILPTLIFINELERHAQKSYAISVLLDGMRPNGHYPGKEIFTAGYYAGRSFDGDHEIWAKFPRSVKLISTLWRLKWLLKHENKTYSVKFADSINSPLEILTVKSKVTVIGTGTGTGNNGRDSINKNPILAETADSPTEADTEEGIEWHFVSTSRWHWLKVIGARGYVKVDDYSEMLVKDSQERSPGEFELHLNDDHLNSDSFHIYWKDTPVRTQIVFKRPFAFVVQKRKNLKLAEFIVAEPNDVDASRVIDLLD